MIPWTPGYDMLGVRVSDADLEAGSPKLGDMIARNPQNHADKWLVARDWDKWLVARDCFGNNLEPVPSDDVPPTCHEAKRTYGLSFGDALRYLKAGMRVTRAGWNGRGMYLWLMPAAVVKAEWCREPHLKALAEQNGGEIECLGTIRMFTVNASGRRAVLTGWLASQSDMLEEDWEVVA